MGQKSVKSSVFSLLSRHYIDILEQNNWGISSYTDDGRVELETYSPAGENFLMCVDVENFPESVREYANYFDANEHAEMWIEARGRVKGVPNSIRELIDDAEAVQKMLNKCLLIKQLSVTSNSYICSGHTRIGTDAKEHKVFASES